MRTTEYLRTTSSSCERADLCGMQGLVPAYRDEAVLVSGRKQCLEVARAYGFARAVSPTQLAAAHGPGAAPFSSVPSPADLHHASRVPCPVAVRVAPLHC